MRATTLQCTFAAGLLVVAAQAVAQQPKPAPPARAVEEQTRRTADGWSLPITYFRSDQGKNAPVVILLHGKEGNRLVWKGLGERLQAAGYVEFGPCRGCCWPACSR